MSKFQVGDKVRCMSSSDRFEARVSDVFEHLGGILTLDGHHGTWSPDHFTLVTRPNEAVNQHVRVYSGGKSYQVPAAEAEALPPALESAQARKNKPLATGCLDYFPAALAAVAELSRIGNQQHNPGEPMHHARSKSADHADALLRHLVERGTVDPSSGLSHTVSVAWRALAMLQEELEAAGAPKARGAK